MSAVPPLVCRLQCHRLTKNGAFRSSPCHSKNKKARFLLVFMPCFFSSAPFLLPRHVMFLSAVQARPCARARAGVRPCLRGRQDKAGKFRLRAGKRENKPFLREKGTCQCRRRPCDLRLCSAQPDLPLWPRRLRQTHFREIVAVADGENPSRAARGRS